jgi:lysophospholipase L1-like esterase
VDDTALGYANLTGRPPGGFVTALGRVLPGIAAVQRQVRPYADAWWRANQAALADSGRRWVVLGDSMSQGIGADTPFGGWVSQLQARLADQDIHLDVVNLSASGALVSDVLHQQLPVWRDLTSRPDGSEPDIVTVLVGSNDLMNRRHRDELPGAFATLLQALPAGAIVATLPQPRRAAIAVNQQIEAVRVERELRVLDMRAGGPPSWRGRLAADHFHPNEDGYRAIADAFFPLVLDAANAA